MRGSYFEIQRTCRRPRCGLLTHITLPGGRKVVSINRATRLHLRHQPVQTSGIESPPFVACEPVLQMSPLGYVRKPDFSLELFTGAFRDTNRPRVFGHDEAAQMRAA
jgi:hypothetical protein